MLEKLPQAIGRTLRRVRPGLQSTVAHRKHIVQGAPTLVLESAAFTDQQAMPARFTADGERVSPPLRWSGVPSQARSLALIVEDADSPTLSPLVHAIMVRLAPGLSGLAEAALGARDDSPLVGKNSFMRAGWLPPDPPPGHGSHRYVFQLFALDHDPHLEAHPGRGALVHALEGHVLAHGILIGTYRR